MSTLQNNTLRAGMVGVGMIFDETYRPFFEAAHRRPLYDPSFGVCDVELAAVASRTGQRGIVGPADGPTWDSTQLRLNYEYEDGREATFDIHTSWVTPDNFSNDLNRMLDGGIDIRLT